MSRSRLPPEHRDPRSRAALAERDVLQVGPDLEPLGANLLDDPTDHKRLPKLPLGDPSRALGAGLLVAEAQQEDATSWLRHMGETCDVACPILIGEDVEQAAVDHAAELPVE